ncbi:hypothetical protein Tco_1155427 [Tanacetum coccineum]
MHRRYLIIVVVGVRWRVAGGVVDDGLAHLDSVGGGDILGQRGGGSVAGGVDGAVAKPPDAKVSSIEWDGSCALWSRGSSRHCSNTEPSVWKIKKFALISVVEFFFTKLPLNT